MSEPCHGTCASPLLCSWSYDFDGFALRTTVNTELSGNSCFLVQRELVRLALTSIRLWALALASASFCRSVCTVSRRLSGRVRGVKPGRSSDSRGASKPGQDFTAEDTFHTCIALSKAASFRACFRLLPVCSVACTVACSRPVPRPVLRPAFEACL